MEAVIYGSGALGRLAWKILRQRGVLEVIGFIDDDPFAIELDIDGLKVIGSGKDLPKLRRFGVEAVCPAIQESEARLWTARLASGIGLEIVSAIHSNAFVSPEASIGHGCIIDEGARVEDGAKVGDCCFLARDSRVQRNAEIGPGTNIPAGIVVEAMKMEEEKELL